MTITSKILARYAGLSYVQAGQIIEAQVELVLGNDISTPFAINVFKELDIPKTFNPDKIYLVPDHLNPSKDIKAAEQTKMMRTFALQYGITHFFEVGRMGIEHCLLPEIGCIQPGTLIIGGDSHTCTYGALGAFATGVGSTDLAAVMATGRIWLQVPESIKCIYSGKLPPWITGKDLIVHTIGDIGIDGARYMAIEFIDNTIQKLSMDSRFTIANMSVEAGAKNGIFPPDSITWQYLGLSKGNNMRECQYSDLNASYREIKTYDVSKIEPQVACPSSPGNVCSVKELGKIPIDQVVIGGCTNGRMEDLRLAASLFRNHQVDSKVRVIIVPGTQKILLQAIKEGLVQTFIEAGCVVSTPTCGPCMGGHMGVIASGEVALSTTNRNFIGRMGSATSQVYLSGPAVAAASAIAGRIIHPEEV